jgi:hypothetical protein
LPALKDYIASKADAGTDFTKELKYCKDIATDKACFGDV